MYRTVYFSSAGPAFSPSDLGTILSAARNNNPALSLTGMLLYCDGNFAQALEGPEDSVRLMTDRIARDPRQTGMIQLIEEPADRRLFPDWVMGFKSLPRGSALPALTADALERRLEGASPSDAERLLRCFFRNAR